MILYNVKVSFPCIVTRYSDSDSIFVTFDLDSDSTYKTRDSHSDSKKGTWTRTQCFVTRIQPWCTVALIYGTIVDTANMEHVTWCILHFFPLVAWINNIYTKLSGNKYCHNYLLVSGKDIKFDEIF